MFSKERSCQFYVLIICNNDVFFVCFFISSDHVVYSILYLESMFSIQGCFLELFTVSSVCGEVWETPIRGESNDYRPGSNISKTK